MPCYMSSSAGWGAFADSEGHLLEYGTPGYYFSFVVSGKTKFHPTCVFSTCSEWTGEFKNAPQMEKIFEPPPPPTPVQDPAHAAGVDV